MSSLGFDKYVDPLKLYLSKYRESQPKDSERQTKKSRVDGSSHMMGSPPSSSAAASLSASTESVDGQPLPPLNIIGMPGNELPSETFVEPPSLVTNMQHLHAMQMMQVHMGAASVPGLPGLSGGSQAADLDPALTQAATIQFNMQMQNLYGMTPEQQQQHQQQQQMSPYMHPSSSS